MNKKWKRDDLIVRSLADSYLPIALVLGFYVILHGNISPGGGFQGGVLAASGVLLLYLGYGFRGIATAINMERMHRLEAVGAIAYVLFAMLGIFAGYNFCRNILWNSGSIGDLWSSGTIALMNYAVGFKVLTGVGFLLLLVIYLLGMDEDHEAGHHQDSRRHGPCGLRPEPHDSLDRLQRRRHRADIYLWGADERNVLRGPHPPGADADEHSHRRLRDGDGPGALRAAV